jgi:signal transduction histidine kinase
MVQKQLERNNKRTAYRKYIYESIYQGIYPRILATFIVISIFIYNDIFVIHSELSLYTRLIIISLSFLTLFFKLFSKNKTLTFYGYLSILVGVYLMMFTKLIIHIDHYDNLNSSILGTIVVIFIISLELKVKPLFSALIFAIPFFLFIIILISLCTPFSIFHRIIINIIPMLVIGFIANTIHNNMRFKLFETSQKLLLEKERVVKQNQELLKIDASKNQLFSIISHDLKSPFSTIIGFSELLSSDYDKYDDTLRKKYINLILESSQKAFDLLVDLLNWSYLQLDGIKLNYKSIVLKGFIDKELDITKMIASKKEISIVNNIESSLELVADKFSISTIVRNIVSNAIKFSRPHSKIYINAFIKDKYIHFTISDEGIGIPEDKINKLFSFDEKFTTLGTDNEKGSGLGLTICKDLVKINHGEISVESKLNKGSKFSFSLKLK